MQDRFPESTFSPLHTSFTLGDLVEDKTTGRRMYVDATWDGKVPCVYFDSERRRLVKEEVFFGNLKKLQETVRRIHVSKYMRVIEYDLAFSSEKLPK
ncbi:hypothetical protein [Leptospira stimsonii]|nr:hypothetical protein [Leptospira stimsonii]